MYLTRTLTNIVVLATCLCLPALMACQEALPVEGLTAQSSELAASKKGGEPASQVFMADLFSLNESGVQGKAKIQIKNGEFVATINATGLVPDNVHAQHIHGFTTGDASACPTPAADTDGDGIISVGEGAPFYGGILVPLDGSLDVAEGLGDPATFPTAPNAAGSISYRETMSLDDLAVNGGLGFDDLSIGQHAIVLHGGFVDGAYEITLPVACGTLAMIN